MDEEEQLHESLEKWSCLLQMCIQRLFPTSEWQHTHSDILEEESKCFSWMWYLVTLLGEVSYYEVSPNQIYHAAKVCNIAHSQHWNQGNLFKTYAKFGHIFVQNPAMTPLITQNIKPCRLLVIFLLLLPTSLSRLILLQLPWPPWYSSNNSGTFPP